MSVSAVRPRRAEPSAAPSAAPRRAERRAEPSVSLEQRRTPPRNCGPPRWNAPEGRAVCFGRRPRCGGGGGGGGGGRQLEKCAPALASLGARGGTDNLAVGRRRRHRAVARQDAREKWRPRLDGTRRAARRGALASAVRMDVWQGTIAPLSPTGSAVRADRFVPMPR